MLLRTRTNRPAVTLGQLRTWAASNDVPLMSVLKDQRGYLVACFCVVEDGELGIIPSAVTDEGKTLADLVIWAAQEPDVKSTTPLFLRTPYGLRDVVDLGHWEQEPGEDYLTLQETWG